MGISSSLGLRLYFARRYDQAIKQFADALELDSNTHSRTFGSGGLTNKRGITGRRLLKSRKPSLFPRHRLFAAELGDAHGLAGRRKEALKVLDGLHKLSKDHYVSAYDQAIVYLGLGEKEQVFAWLQKAVQERSPMLVNLPFVPGPARTCYAGIRQGQYAGLRAGDGQTVSRDSDGRDPVRLHW